MSSERRIGGHRPVAATATVDRASSAPDNTHKALYTNAIRRAELAQTKQALRARSELSTYGLSDEMSEAEETEMVLFLAYSLKYGADIADYSNYIGGTYSGGIAKDRALSLLGTAAGKIWPNKTARKILFPGVEKEPMRPTIAYAIYNWLEEDESRRVPIYLNRVIKDDDEMWQREPIQPSLNSIPLT